MTVNLNFDVSQTEADEQIQRVVDLYIRDIAEQLASEIDPTGSNPNLADDIETVLKNDPEFRDYVLSVLDADPTNNDLDNNGVDDTVDLAQKAAEAAASVTGSSVGPAIQQIIQDQAAKTKLISDKIELDTTYVKATLASKVLKVNQAYDWYTQVKDSGGDPTEGLDIYIEWATMTWAAGGIAGAAKKLLGTNIFWSSVIGIVSSETARPAVDWFADQTANHVDNGINGIVDMANALHAVASAIGITAGTLINLLDSVLNAIGVDSNLGGWFVAFWEATGDAAWMGSPLVLDLDNDGIELISLEQSDIFWDIDEDGFAEKTGWAKSDDGFLAIDLNNDGIITDHTELFGSITEDGFTALSVYDTNADGVIDANDTQFGDLLVWQDLNENAVSEADELYTLADLDIVSIDLNASTPYEMYIEGHNISHVSSYTVDDGVNGPQTFEIVDAWFQHDNRNTEYIEDYDLDIEALFTTTIRGYGTLPDLHVSASIDNDVNDPNSLLSLLQNFTSNDLESLFAGDKSIMDQTRDIMLRWAGADTVDPTSMGQWADAQELTFINALRGEQWLWFGNDPNPWSASSQGLQKAFDIAHYAITARLIGQAAGAQLFNDETYYNPATDAFEDFTAFNQDALDDLVDKSLDGTQVENKTEYWVQVVNLVDNTVGISNLDTTQYNVLEASIQASDSTLTIVDLQDKIAKNIEDNLSWTPDGDYILGTSAVETYDGTVGDDFYSGAAGDDILNGGLGNDQLRGDADNDTLDGQLGNDILWGGHGDDIYKFFLGHGDDTISDTSGSDKILFGEGITATDLSLIRVGYYDLVIQIDPTVGYGSIHIQNQMSAALIETLEFDDGSTLDMGILDHTYIGTEENETIYGVRTGLGGSGVDTIYGNGGDDVIYGYGPTGGASSAVQNTLYGGDGNDTLFAETGGDYLNGEAGDDDIRGHVGNDTIIGGLGNDVLDGSRGDDVYHFNYGDGNDVIDEDRGTDKIVFGAGITAAMLDITRLNNNDILIDIDGGLGGSIEINWQTYGTATILETLEFSDASTIDLTALDLTLNGTSAGETLYGVRFGGSGIDTIYGHEGNDVIYGYRQVADYENNFLYAGDGDDTVYAAHGDDYVEGNDGNDTVFGYNGVDTIYGGSGDDTLRGGNQDDLLYGEDGNDVLLGENNDDTLIGGLGADELTGGGGNDTFTFLAASSFDAVDTIKDFNTTYDAIDIADVLNGYDPLTDAITDFVQITDDGTDSTLFIDADGGADNFVAIALIENKVGLTDESALETSGNLITV